MRHTRALVAILWILCVGSCAVGPVACGAQVLETETARFLEAGGFELNAALEFQTSGEGTERAVPLAIEYFFLRRFSFLVEPVAYTAIRPNEGAHATGAGDVEVTGTYLLLSEAGGFPAVALAGEVKFPTAKNTLIGTGKTDYTGYLIASKRVGPFDLHGNLGYAVLGEPAGVTLNDIVTGALAIEYFRGRVEWFAEGLGNTSATPEGGPENTSDANPVTAEVAGAELVGTVGVGAFLWPSVFTSIAVSYDNNQAVQIRPAILFRPR